jgi:hypothetical protein
MPFTNIIFANEADARTYFLSPSSQALFMDPANPVFYVKSTDSFGSPTFEKYSFQRIDDQQQSESPLTQADLDTFKQEILALIQGGIQNESDNKPTLNNTANN